MRSLARRFTGVRGSLAGLVGISARHSAAGVGDGRENPLITSAAAQIAGERDANVLVRWILRT